jgi:hypothetical protein
MPSRLVVLAIVLFWLVSTTWLVVREIVPLYRAGQPPAFFTDVITEVSGTTINWKLLKKGQSIGIATSQIQPVRSDRGYELTSTLQFEDFRLATVNIKGVQIKIEIKKIVERFRLSRHGKLKEASVEVRMLAPAEVRAELKGVVEDGMFHSKVTGLEKYLGLGPFEPPPVPVASMGDILNTMHPLNRIPALWVGRTWKVAYFNPLGLVIPGGKLTPSTMIAEVEEDVLEWQHETVPCFRIDYRKTGKKATAHTWVRRSDGLVLCQQVSDDGMDLEMVREVQK